MLTPDELERYKRQMTLDGFGREAQERLKDATVLVAGIGGLGGTAALYLATAGIGRLILCHEGDLTLSNLNRQILMTADRIGRPRVITAMETIRDINPNVSVSVFDEPIRMKMLKTFLPDVDLIIDARHNFPERRVINRASVEGNVPLVEAAMNGMEGYIFNIIPGKTPCLHCLYPDDPEWDPYGFSVLGAVSGAVGCMAAVEAIKLITGFKKPMTNTLLQFDLGNMAFRRFNLNKRKDCEICGHLSLQDIPVSVRRQVRNSDASTSRSRQGAIYPATTVVADMTV